MSVVFTALLALGSTSPHADAPQCTSCGYPCLERRFLLLTIPSVKLHTIHPQFHLKWPHIRSRLRAYLNIVFFFKQGCSLLSGKTHGNCQCLFSIDYQSLLSIDTDLQVYGWQCTMTVSFMIRLERLQT